MKVTFTCDTGANIHSARTTTWDLAKQRDVDSFGYTLEEWKQMPEKDKNQAVQEWADNYLEIYWDEE